MTSKQLHHFLSKVIIDIDNGGCWIWQGCCSRGYGMVKFDYVLKKASRVSYDFFVGPIGNLNVLHKCDNPPCINPEHLYLGTQKENIQEMFSKGRGNRAIGVMNGSAKLNEIKVRECRALYSQGVSIRQIAKKYGLDPASMQKVVKFKTWKHVK